MVWWFKTLPMFLEVTSLNPHHPIFIKCVGVLEPPPVLLTGALPAVQLRFKWTPIFKVLIELAPCPVRLLRKLGLMIWDWWRCVETMQHMVRACVCNFVCEMWLIATSILVLFKSVGYVILIMSSNFGWVLIIGHITYV